MFCKCSWLDFIVSHGANGFLIGVAVMFVGLLMHSVNQPSTSSQIILSSLSRWSGSCEQFQKNWLRVRKWDTRWANTESNIHSFRLNTMCVWTVAGSNPEASCSTTAPPCQITVSWLWYGDYVMIRTFHKNSQTTPIQFTLINPYTELGTGHHYAVQPC